MNATAERAPGSWSRWSRLPDRLVFVVPCHRRHAISEICLRQLARTCAALAPVLKATAVVGSAEPFFAGLAGELGFGHVTQENRPLGRKWNDLYELACRMLDADFVVPIGSDDIVDWRLFATHLPGLGEVRASRLCTLISPDGEKLLPLAIKYAGGDGIRVFRADSLERFSYRPAGESADRALDTSIVTNWIRVFGRGPRFVYHDLHSMQIIGLKSSYGQEQQLNGYSECRDHASEPESGDALDRIAEVYPAELIEELRAHYATVREPVAA